MNIRPTAMSTLMNKGMVLAIVISVVFGSVIALSLSYVTFQNALNTNTNTLTSSFNVLNAKLIDLQDKLAADETKLMTLQGNMTGIAAQIEALQGDVVTLQELVTTKADVASINAQIGNIETELAEVDNKIMAFYMVFYEMQGTVLVNVTINVANPDLTWNVTGINLESPRKFIAPLSIYQSLNEGQINLYNPTGQDVEVQLSATSASEITTTLSDTSLTVPANSMISFTITITLTPNIQADLYWITLNIT